MVKVALLDSAPVLFGLALAWSVGAETLPRERMEDFLLHGSIRLEAPGPANLPNSKIITFIDGDNSHMALVEAMASPKDAARFTVAAYRLDKLLDLGLVPVSVSREIDGTPAVVTWQVDDVQFDEAGRREKKENPPDLNDWARQMNVIRDFDQLIGNSARGVNSLLIDKSWRVWLADQEKCFGTASTLPHPENLRRISRKMFEGIKKLDRQSVEAAVGPLLTSEEIQALLARRDALVKFFADQIAANGEDAIFLEGPKSVPEVTIP
jgi:hypothetical protein